MKMKKGTLKGTLAAVAIVGTTATVFATTSVNVDAQQSTQGNPTVSSQERSKSNFEVVHLKEMNGFPFDEPSQNDISAQEAGEIGANAIEQFFDVSLEGATIYMTYIDYSIAPQSIVENSEGSEVSNFEQVTPLPNTWNGSIMPHGVDLGSGINEYGFSIDSETGELTGVSFIPDAAATIGVEQSGSLLIFGEIDNTPPGATVLFRETPNEQHNYEFSRYAMQLVEERNILDGEITRARISGISTWFRGWDNAEAIGVWVQNENGENAELIFTGFSEDEKELVNVRLLGVEEPHLQDKIYHDSRGNVINTPDTYSWVNR